MSKDITDELIIREETSGYSFEKSKSDMEEDLKILELTIEDSKDYGQYCLTRTELEALEHLIKAYKEKEEENKKLKTEKISYLKELEDRENKMWQLKSQIQDLENECVSLHELIDEEM